MAVKAPPRPSATAELDQLRAVDRDLGVLAKRFTADGLIPTELRQGLELATRVVNKATSLQRCFAKAVSDTGAWEGTKHRSPAHFVGDAAGTSIKGARDLLETAAALQQLPATERAARNGELSGPQATAVTRGAAANPAAEGHLLDTARQGSLKELEDESLRAKAAADPDREATRRRIHEHRTAAVRTDTEGGWHLHGYDTTDIGAQVMGVLDPISRRLFQAARKEGRRESPAAYLMDALVEAICGTGAAGGKTKDKGASSGHAKFIVRIDYEALRRGRVQGDELADIPGVGPVSVAAIKRLALEESPFWAAIITKGQDVVNVAHLGRRPNAFQRTALEWLSGECAVRGCSQRVGLQTDHREDFRFTKHTLLPQLDQLCPYHHRLKTYEGWMLVEGTAKREMVPPDDLRHPGYGKRVRTIKKRSQKVEKPAKAPASQEKLQGRARAPNDRS